MKLKQIIMMGLSAAVLAGCAGGKGVSDSGETREVTVRVAEGAVDPTTAGGEDPNETVCVRRHKVGSHFPRTTCKTRKQWDEDRDAARRDLDRQREQTASGRMNKSLMGGNQ